MKTIASFLRRVFGSSDIEDVMRAELDILQHRLAATKRSACRCQRTEFKQPKRQP